MTQEGAGGHAEGGGLELWWLSDMGPVRGSNEDACLVLPARGLLAVSDGMGGELAGDVASRLTLEWLPEFLEGHLQGSAELAAHEAELVVRDAVAALSRRLRSERRGPGTMGATLAMVLMQGRRAHVANMGDSRVYLLRLGRLTRLTRDHSVLATLVERGAITREQAASHPLRGYLSRYVGMNGDGRPDVWTQELRGGDWLLLCTDGLTDAVPDERIQGILVGAEGPGQAAEELVEAAKSGGSRDNITVVLAEWGRN